MPRCDPAELERYQVHRDKLARVRERKRLAAVEIRPLTPKQQVQEMENGRRTPVTLRNLTRIANDPRRSAAIRVRAAAAILKLGYGDTDYADG